MLEFLRGKVSDRKVRLFAVACCRRVWPLVKDDRFRAAAQAAELFADGIITKEDMIQARSTALAVFVKLRGGEDEAPAATLSAAAIPAPPKSFEKQFLDVFADPWWEDELDKGDPHGPAVVTARHTAWAVAQAQGQRPLADSTGAKAEQREQATLLRELLGSPFRPIALDPTWLEWNDGTVRKMATAIYEERAFDRLPLLADALEEAGCTDADILAHCRSGGEHVRGCWVVDLLLGKS
ncbi:MAG TPA: hypothetical protein VMS17_29155 [Gemmataceae bacterium]|nr:hypothetical protein [Gemmataceae bacterium]